MTTITAAYTKFLTVPDAPDSCCLGMLLWCQAVCWVSQFW